MSVLRESMEWCLPRLQAQSSEEQAGWTNFLLCQMMRKKKPVEAMAALQHALQQPPLFVSPMPEEWKILNRQGAWMLPFWEARYPALLRTLDDPPLVLFGRGAIECLSKASMAVVGTRKPSAYGRRCAFSLAGHLAQAGFQIVSGLAYGIDAIAHRSALEAGMTTVAVLACGIDRIYPVAHRTLAEDIVQQGALLSEYPPGTPPRGFHFRHRNRLLSGLSHGVLVVEAQERSGTMITARCAAEQGRDVFAVPGNIDQPQSAGTNRLILQGAKLVRSVHDVLEEYEGLLPKGSGIKNQPEDLPKDQALLYDRLQCGMDHTEALLAATGWTPSRLWSVLGVLEWNGWIERAPGGRWIARRPSRK